MTVIPALTASVSAQMSGMLQVPDMPTTASKDPFGQLDVGIKTLMTTSKNLPSVYEVKSETIDKTKKVVEKKKTDENKKSYKNEAWIEVRATKINVYGVNLPVWHTLILYHDTDDRTYLYRGGPQPDAPPGYYGTITGTSELYRFGGTDYAVGAPSKRVMTGKDAEGKNTCFQKELDRITSSKINYHLNGPNSNSVVYTLLVNCNVPVGKPVAWVPGWDTQLIPVAIDNPPEKVKVLKNVTSDQKNKEINDLRAKADGLVVNGKYQEAKKYYEQVLQIDPMNSYVLDSLGNSYEKLGDYEKAMKYYNMALESNPNYISAQNDKKALQGKLQGKTTATANEQKKKGISDLLDEGNRLIGEGKYQEAIKIYEQALQIDPKNSDALNNLGLIYLKLKDYKNAKKYFDMAPESDPANNNAQNDKKALQGKTTAQANEQKNNEVKDLRAKADGLVVNGKYQEAIKIYEQALKIDSNNFSNLWRLGYVYLKLGDYGHARDYYEQAFQIDHKDSYILSTLGYIYENLGDDNEAMKYYNKANESDPSYKYAQDLKKALQQKLQQKTTATANEQKKKGISDLLDEGNRLIGEGKYQEAIKIFEQILKIDPRNSGALNGLGAAYYSLEDYEKALEYFNKALEVDPSNTFAQNNKKSAEEKLQQNPKISSTLTEAGDVSGTYSGYFNGALSSPYFTSPIQYSGTFDLELHKTGDNTYSGTLTRWTSDAGVSGQPQFNTPISITITVSSSAFSGSLVDGTAVNDGAFTGLIIGFSTSKPVLNGQFNEKIGGTKK